MNISENNIREWEAHLIGDMGPKDQADMIIIRMMGQFIWVMPRDSVMLHPAPLHPPDPMHPTESIICRLIPLHLTTIKIEEGGNLDSEGNQPLVPTRTGMRPHPNCQKMAANSKLISQNIRYI